MPHFTMRFIVLFAFYVMLNTRCFAFVLMSSSSRVFETQIFEPGGAWSYQFYTTILLNEKDGVHTKDVGFHIASDLHLESIWSGQDHYRLIKIKLENPKLHIRSRKIPTPEGFVPHTSLLDNLPNKPFYILWNKGTIEKLYVATNESPSLVNYKKGISSLFQFQLLDQELIESDSSGTCVVTYTSAGPTGLNKSKKDCTSRDFIKHYNPKPLLDVLINSMQDAHYDFSESYIKSITSSEKHVVSLSAKEEVGNEVETKQELLFVSSGKATERVDGENLDDAINKLFNKYSLVTYDSLLTEKEHIAHDDNKNFADLVNGNREVLKSKQLGSITSARAFTNLVSAARKAGHDEIVKALKNKKNQPIMHQIYDILGFAQTSNSHSAAMKNLHFDKFEQQELSERYLWALSVNSQPNPEIMTDLLNKYKKTESIPQNVKETLILSIASMAYHLSKLPDRADFKLQKEIETTIVNYLDASKNEDRMTLLRALVNLRSATTIPTLLKIATKGSLKEGVLAWKALKALEPEQITQDVVKAAFLTFLQLDRKHDSSSRTLALEIILQSNPDEKVLEGVLFYLASGDKAYEVKQYTIQRLKMLADSNEEFRLKLLGILNKEKRINNYAVFGQKGLSVSLSRKFLSGASSNGSLVTVQEMHGGIVKRGVVNVMMDKSGISQEMFSLGIFSGGLGSFFSSDSEGESEEATAGMELSVMGTQVRPFTFFRGQGELMGHVWSGTGSDKMTAFQALSLLQDHNEFIRLGPGFVAEIDVKGSTSFDLSGQVEFSLWNRNAKSLVEKSAGIIVIGILRVDTSFLKSQSEFSISVEPKLRLQADIDFSSGINLCMRLTQPEAIFRHNIYKIERITGSKHKLRKTRTKKYPVPGVTYALNKKNTDMCNAIFS